MQGKLLRVIKGPYKNVKTYVTSDGFLGDFFKQQSWFSGR